MRSTSSGVNTLRLPSRSAGSGTCRLVSRYTIRCGLDCTSRATSPSKSHWLSLMTLSMQQVSFSRDEEKNLAPGNALDSPSPRLKVLTVSNLAPVAATPGAGLAAPPGELSPAHPLRSPSPQEARARGE